MAMLTIVAAQHLDTTSTVLHVELLQTEVPHDYKHTVCRCEDHVMANLQPLQCSPDVMPSLSSFKRLSADLRSAQRRSVHVAFGDIVEQSQSLNLGLVAHVQQGEPHGAWQANGRRMLF